MSQFVLKQIAYRTIQKGHVSIHDHMLFQVSRYFVMSLSQGRLVNINELSHNIGEVNWAAIYVKRPSLSFGKIQRDVQQMQELIQAFDRLPNGVAPLLV
ncbi:MAG: hypothetical protein WA741_22870, partial [Candidatus Sulfotelmatobacter sp.]